MRDLVSDLHKRRMKMMFIVLILACISIVVIYNFSFTPSNYFDGKYNNDFLLFLIIYKLIELPVLYYLLMHKHVINIKKDNFFENQFEKIKKHTKLLLFLVPQGNTVFGFIAYKLTANVSFFLLFSSIALITLYLIKPNKLLL